jgi:hypothetical protein
MRANLIELCQNVTIKKLECIYRIIFAIFFFLGGGWGKGEETFEIPLFNLVNEAPDILILSVIFVKWPIHFRMQTQVKMIK